ncbi:hypothetical protein EDB85DRAFT_1886604 [Lactarius pseudohatsudake]|nr:hypothetical protein EDB85DRAFT_1886604 [Lactarius pseudohatsudake]
MPLTIVLNTLYSSKGREREREAAKRHILAHFVRMGLEKDGVEVATARNIGWHGEGGVVRYGGHLTVDFSKRSGRFTTEHVYRTDAAYEGRTTTTAAVAHRPSPRPTRDVIDDERVSAGDGRSITRPTPSTFPTRAQHVADQGSHLCEVLRRTEARTTMCDRLRPPNPRAERATNRRRHTHPSHKCDSDGTGTTMTAMTPAAGATVRRTIQPRQSGSVANYEQLNHDKVTTRNDNDNNNDNDDNDNNDNDNDNNDDNDDVADDDGDATTAGGNDDAADICRSQI